MRQPADRALRAAVHELADGARTPPELASRALARGRRLRRRRRAVTTVAAAVALAAGTVPVLLLRPAPAPPVVTASPSAAPAVVHPTLRPDVTAPVVLPGGWVVTGILDRGAEERSGYLLDRAAGRYRNLTGYDAIWPSPRGDVAAVLDRDRHPGKTGLVDLVTGATRWIETGKGINDAAWSPDGSRLAVTRFRDGTHALGILTVGGTWRNFPFPPGALGCTDYCAFTWSGDGREVTLPQTDGTRLSESERHKRRGVRFFSPDDGRPTRFAPVAGDPAGSWSWSPDGTRAVVLGQRGPELVEVATGRVLGTLPEADLTDPRALPVWVDDDRLLYRERDNLHDDMVLVEVAGRELERQPLPREWRRFDVTVAPR